MTDKKIKKEITNQDLARQMAGGFKLVTREIKHSQEELARMVAEGFANTATKAEIAEIKDDLEGIKLKFDHIAYKFEVKDLQKRVSQLEHKVGIK